MGSGEDGEVHETADWSAAPYRKFGNQKNLAAHAERRLRAIVTRLEKWRRTLIGSGNQETAQLLSLAILQLRIKHKGIADSELKALCDAMIPDAPVMEPLRPKSQPARRRRAAAFLKLVE